jgi:uncharacterized repeat protein (TIGR04138 family)
MAKKESPQTPGQPAGEVKSTFQIARDDGRYPPDAFEFVQEGLNHTLSQLSKPRHVSGAELCRGIADLAAARYGLMARTVLARWHITGTRDIGEIVFAMIAAGVMSKCDQDDIEDFNDVFDFHEVFDRRFAIDLKD